MLMLVFVRLLVGCLLPSPLLRLSLLLQVHLHLLLARIDSLSVVLIICVEVVPRSDLL